MRRPPAEAAATVRWVNDASKEDFIAAGVYEKGMFLLMNGQPYWKSVEHIAATRGIGKKTMEAVKRAAKRANN